MTGRFVSQLVPPGGWATQHSRLPPVSRRDIGPGARFLLAAVEKIGKLDAENLWLMLSRNPRLLRGMMYMASRLMPFGELARRDTELVILRARKDGRAPFRLHAPQVLHAADRHLKDGDDYRPEIVAVLKGGAGLPWPG